MGRGADNGEGKSDQSAKDENQTCPQQQPPQQQVNNSDSVNIRKELTNHDLINSSSVQITGSSSDLLIDIDSPSLATDNGHPSTPQSQSQSYQHPVSIEPEWSENLGISQQDQHVTNLESNQEPLISFEDTLIDTLPVQRTTEGPYSSTVVGDNRIETGGSLIDSRIIPSVSVIGHYRPFWIPDSDAPMCMMCDAKFTVIKRRHHCRGCGKVLCGQCCSARVPIPYLDYEKARVCSMCLPFLTDEEDCFDYDESNNSSNSRDYENDSSLPSSPRDRQHFLHYPIHQTNDFASSPSSSSSPITRTNGSNHLNQTSACSQSVGAFSNLGPSPVGVLKRSDSSNSRPRSEPKQVIFSDGIRPGNDLQDDQFSPFGKQRNNKGVKSTQKSSTQPQASGASCPPHPSSSSKQIILKNSHSHPHRTIIRDSKSPLPPVINCPLLQTNPTTENLLVVLADETLPPVTFCLTKNLLALVKLVKLDCCVGVECWAFTSQNLASVGQDEVIVLLERLPDEKSPPQDIFRLFIHIYDSATRGMPFTELTNILYPEGILDSKENAGFLFIRPTFQCLSKIVLPSPPFLVGVLILKWEIPWVKVFPLRLILSLGAEYKCYPTPIFSHHRRKPAYFEIGHTIINILADFRNYQYSLPVVPGLTIHTDQATKQTTVNFPRNRYDKVMKAISTSNEHVLSFGGNFDMEADSHLTCIQNDDGQYHTQTITITPDTPPSITGASFIVFIGSLKPSTGLKAKVSVVEDGLLVHMPANSLLDLKNKLKEMDELHIECGKIDAEKPDEIVHLVWEKEDKQFNIGVRSCIDCMSLEGVRSLRIFNGTDYEGERYLMRWTELFLIQDSESEKGLDDSNRATSRRGSGGFHGCLGGDRAYDAGKLAEIVAQSFCLALMSHLDSLVEKKLFKIALRVSVDADKVGYDAGSNGEPLPSCYVSQLDAALIPTIMSNIATDMDFSLVMELIFYILV
ncbi:smad anchor for receptor activation [Brevipalpus obovatus]|uniref:smad anchor for receptor activation n=1 Tax=Brevipalpus obovatus TaxID=246614 RepID=UPI003D9F2B74